MDLRLILKSAVEEAYMLLNAVKCITVILWLELCEPYKGGMYTGTSLYDVHVT